MSCTLHRLHRPKALTVERHHVIPRAWQASWSPPLKAESVVPMPTLPHPNQLWHPETVTLCPTSHRNVHYWIVRLMKGGASDELPSFRGLGREGLIAYQALQLWRSAGGSLVALRKAGFFGEA